VRQGEIAELRAWVRDGEAWAEETVTGGDPMASIRIPTPLRNYTQGQSEVAAEGETVRALLQDLAHRYAGLQAQLLDDAGELRRFVNVFLNGDDIRSHAGLQTPVADGDVLEILPAIAGGISFPEWRAQLQQQVAEIDARELAAAIAGRPAPVLLDVRTEEEWAQGHLPGALHLDRGYLELRAETLVPDKEAPVVCYCGSGVRSLFAAQTLRTLGYRRVQSLARGFAGWKEAGLPFVQPVALSASQRRRYLRHLAIPEVGEEGQAKLLAAKVLCIGAGGLGCPAAIYLAAAGVGTLGIVDDDQVDESNLQRQILHTTARIGTPKTASARIAIEALNPDVKVIEHTTRLSAANVLDMFAGYDLIVDGSDNFPTRYLVNDACVKLGKSCVHGSIFRFEGQLTVFWPGHGPCYRCLYPEPPPPELAPSCAEAGVLGVLPGVIGVLQAVETIKLILGRGEPLVGRLLLYDALAAEFRELRVQADPHCRYCAPGAEFPGLVDYEHFCASAGRAA
jgi:molybdopterin/thiamine biosynthesis adenylyltransferase/rhodanese-related sulfurtransferase/molybdopterin converting factor small subunit